MADNTIKRSPMHDDLQAAGYQHQTTSPYNGLAKHTYSGHGGYSEVLNKHGYKQITNTVWKHEASDDSVQLRPADQGHKLVHTHHDKSYQYPNEDVEQKVGEMLEFEKEGNLTVESKQRMTQMFIEAAATYAAEAVADLVAMTNESVERMEQVVEWMEGQMQQQEQRQDYLGEALVGLVQDVYTDEGDANEFLERVRQRVAAQGSNNFKGAGVSDDAPARNLASVAGRSVAPTNSTGDHGGVVRESLSKQTRGLLDSQVLAESQNHQSSGNQRKTLGVLLGSTNLKGRTGRDGYQQRSQTLMETTGMTSVDVYCALEDARGHSWASGR